MSDHVPHHNPLPGYLKEPEKKVSYYLYLQQISRLFRGADADEMPTWLVGAIYDCIFDPDVQAWIGGRLSSS